MYQLLYYQEQEGPSAANVAAANARTVQSHERGDT